MAEIKSSIEIAMEKTKGLILSREEMQKIKDEELRTKAQSLVHRFLEVDFHLREVEKELAKLEADQKKILEKLIWQQLLEALDLDRDNDLILEGLATLRPESSPLLKELKTLLAEYQQKKNSAFAETTAVILKNLEKKGISGTALQPKVAESKEWAEVVAKIKLPLAPKLQKFQEELKSM
ncbi:MAG: hypothetical protein ACPL5I_06790 [Thermodesulfobacteriota bacterium]